MKTPIVVMAVVGLLLCSVPAMADPVKVYQVEDPIQDEWLLDDWVEELSTAPWDPVNDYHEVGPNSVGKNA